MNRNGQFPSAAAGCEAVARSHGHAQGKWLPINARLYVSMCEVCNATIWLARPGYEKRWRVGGTALDQDCLKGYPDSELGA